MTRRIVLAAFAAVTAPAVGGLVLCLLAVAAEIAPKIVVASNFSVTETMNQVLGPLATYALIVGLAVSYVIALPIALVLNVILRRVGWSKCWHYAAAGAAVGLAVSPLPLFLLGGSFLIVSGMPIFGSAGAIAGMCAAVSFWAIAVRGADLRAALRPSPRS